MIDRSANPSIGSGKSYLASGFESTNGFADRSSSAASSQAFIADVSNRRARPTAVVFTEASKSPFAVEQ
jgi:hypothetical protein